MNGDTKTLINRLPADLPKAGHGAVPCKDVRLQHTSFASAALAPMLSQDLQLLPHLQGAHL